jgi:glycerol uptake facilitator-like aquaporin
MGGDDSQKLLPWRGAYSSPGRKPPAHYEFNTVTENCRRDLARATIPRPASPGAWLSYRLPGLFLESRPGSLLPRAEVFSEFVATFGLLSVIWGVSRQRSAAVPFAVGAYITGAYWFTASTSFANPAVTIARSFTNTFSGIRPADAPGLIIGQVVGAFAATFLFRWLIPSLPEEARNVVLPHSGAKS